MNTLWLLVLAALATSVSGAPIAVPSVIGAGEAFGIQYVYLVRHGDKSSSYPPCGPNSTAGDVCYDAEATGNNCPITPCGTAQANKTAAFLADKDISHIMSSPFARAMQTALPLAKMMGLQIAIEPMLSEDRQSDGPFRANNANSLPYVLDELEALDNQWDRAYGAPPIPTPETDSLFFARLAKASRQLRARIANQPGNHALYSHATTVFSIAYGLCHVDDNPKEFLEEYVNGQDPIGPGGFIRVAFEVSSGKCEISQTNNLDNSYCGKTKPYYCRFADCSTKYWPFPQAGGGNVDANCNCKVVPV